MCHLYSIDDDKIQHFIIKTLCDNTPEVTRQEHFLEAETALQRLTDLKSATLELPDVILLDLNMPGMDGWGFLASYQKVLPEIKKKIKVIILSSSASKMEKSRSMDFPFVTGYLTKPVTLETIQTILSVV